MEFTDRNNITTILCGFNFFLLGINKSDKNEIGDKHDILVKLARNDLYIKDPYTTIVI